MHERNVLGPWSFGAAAAVVAGGFFACRMLVEPRRRFARGLPGLEHGEEHGGRRGGCLARAAALRLRVRGRYGRRRARVLPAPLRGVAVLRLRRVRTVVWHLDIVHAVGRHSSVRDVRASRGRHCRRPSPTTSPSRMRFTRGG